MKTKLLFLLLCIVATSNTFAQSKQKQKTQAIIKTETEAESTDFEVIQKVHYSLAGCGVRPPNGGKCDQPTIQSYRFSIKPLVDDIIMYSVNYGKKTVKTDNKTVLMPFEIYHYGCKPEMIAVPSGDFSKIKIVFEYKKNGKTKRFVVTNLNKDHHKRP